MHPLLELGITRVPCPVPFPEAGGPANVYAIEEADGGVALFDAGIGTPLGEAALRDGLRALGLHFKDVRRVYLSHGHVDHYGLAQSVSEESGAPVFIHEADRDKVERPAEEWRRSRGAYQGYLRRLGVDEDALELLERGHRQVLTLARPIEHTRPVEAGETLQFARFSATVLHSPGHTPGLTCLHVASHGLLFSDDHLLERVSPNPLLEIGAAGEAAKFRSLATYLKTLAKTRELELSLILPGHAQPFHDHRRVIDGLLGFYAGRQARLLEKLAEGPKTALELVQHVFPRVGVAALFLTLSEIVGNLEVLEERGQVAMLPPAPLYRWQLV